MGGGAALRGWPRAENSRPNCVGAALGVFSGTWAQGGRGSPANSADGIALAVHLEFPPGDGRGAREFGGPIELRWRCTWSFLREMGAGRTRVARALGAPAGAFGSNSYGVVAGYASIRAGRSNCVGAALGVFSRTWSRGGSFVQLAGAWGAARRVCLRSPRRGGVERVWIPFGDHPLKLERYRED